MDLTVVKRDGTSEPFNYDKLVASITKTGIPVNQGEEISSRVKIWAESSAKEGNIESSLIRDKIIELLSEDFPAEADTYKAYKK